MGDEAITEEERLRQEDQVREKSDEKGNIWRKLYLGGGAHFRNWLDQSKEIYGEENVEVEEIDPTGFKCFEEGDEKIYRIWARIKKD
ncbi:hypothetical protein ACFLTZ_01905 [Chloroflexota bacterium]